GVTGYRFSIAWSRIFPNGTGQPNEKGLSYYQRVVDELLQNNIAPFVTLFHWDLPQSLPDGWQSRDTVKAFADYAAYVSKHLSDRVQHFFTTNELVCFTDLSYKIGQFAPGLKLPDAQVNQIRHHGVLAHGMAVHAVRADGSKDGYAVEQKQTSYPHMASPWLKIGPEVIYWAVRNVSDIWKPKVLYITENGCSADDVITANGRIEDTDRVMYLRNHLM